MQYKAIVFTKKNEIKVSSFNLRDLQNGEVLIQTQYSCLSPGTELRCLRGGEPNACDFPFIPGYALTGSVIAKGDDVDIPLGTKVFSAGTTYANECGIAWGGHVSHAICNVEDVVLIPTGISLLDASFLALSSIAFHGVRLSKPLLGEKIVIIGLGVIGQISARLHAMSGADVIACDMSPYRVQIAREANINAILIEKDLSQALESFLPNGADVVVDATGSTGTISKALELIKDIPWDNSPNNGGRFVIQGSYEKNIEIPYSTIFNKEINILVPRDNQLQDKIAVFELMQRNLLDISNLITEVYPPEDAVERYTTLQKTKNNALTYVFKWR